MFLDRDLLNTFLSAFLLICLHALPPSGRDLASFFLPWSCFCLFPLAWICWICSLGFSSCYPKFSVSCVLTHAWWCSVGCSHFKFLSKALFRWSGYWFLSVSNSISHLSSGPARRTWESLWSWVRIKMKLWDAWFGTHFLRAQKFDMSL